MPDISMCWNKTCPKRNGCYRYRAIANTHQTFADFKPGDNGACDAYWPIGDRKNLRAPDVEGGA